MIPKLIITAGLMLANLALSMTKKIEGPRLTDLKFTSGDYGVPLAMVWALRRMEVPIFWAEDLREVKRRRKTKGGKYNDYSYFGTWAVALAGHQIEAVRRIWFDTHLVYDLSGAGPVTPFDFGTNNADVDEHVAIYLGTETQEPDPRMQATVEAEFGEGSCPAYRGTAYICFKDIPLEKLGNRIPQVSVEIVGASSTIYPSETLNVGATWIVYSYDKLTLAAVTFGNETSIVDVAARAVIATWDAGNFDSSAESVGFLEDGSVIGDIGGDVVKVSLGGGTTTASTTSVTTVTSVLDGNGNEWWMGFSGSDVVINGLIIDPSTDWPYDMFASQLFVDTDGDVWAVGRKNALTSTECGFYNLSRSELVIATGLPSWGNSDACAFHYSDDTHDHFVLAWDDKLYTIDRTDGSIIDTKTDAHYGADANFNGMRAVIPGASSFWNSFEEISSVDLSTVRDLDRTDWGPAGANAVTIYDPINHALLEDSGSSITWRYLDRIGADGVTLATIAGDIADWCGIEDYDFSDLDQEVTGWSATRGPASNMLEPLLDAYDSDIRPHDFTIEGLKRTGVASGATLATEWFTGDPRYTVKLRQAAELPRAVLVDFADIDADQQPNTARADRPLDATGAVGEKKIDLTTLALDTDEARNLADRYFRRLWNERKEAGLSLTAQELKLEPGDVRTLELDGEEFDARCVRVTIQADDILACEWKYDHPSLALLDGTAGATFDGRDETTIVVPVLSKGFVLDIPLLTDSDDATVPQVYTLAAPYADGAWPGAVLYQAVGDEYSDELAAVPSSSAATWGYADELPYANPNLWDRGSEITVTLQTGELTGCTEDAANADPTLNLAAIGSDGRWEIVQFTVATLTAPLTYTVSGFKRGRRGTEWAAELHEAGDIFVLLDTADAQTMGLSEVGTDLSFKAITAGRTSGFPFGYEYEGQSLKPYAPCHLEAVKESNDDWTISWVRRTRVGGDWTSGTTIPLSETTEEYEVEILDSLGAVVRTFTATDITENGDGGSVTYTAADQITDGGDVAEGDLSFRVYQISAAVDRGFPRAGAA